MKRLVFVAFALIFSLLSIGAAARPRAFQSYNVSGRGGYQQGFDPMTLPSPSFFVRTDRGITVATGVSSWADQSGNGRTPVQATGAKQPAYATHSAPNMPTVTFNSAANQVLTVAATAIAVTGWTMAAVAQFNVACQSAACYSVSFGAATNGNSLKVDTAPKRNVQARGVVDREDGNATTATESWIATNDGTTTKLWLNGVLQAALTNATTNAASSGAGIFIGSDVTLAGFMSGVVYEVASWQRVLDPSEITRLARYEANLFGSQ